MARFDGARARGAEAGADLAQEIVALAPRDLVFTMQFLGETQFKM